MVCFVETIQFTNNVSLTKQTLGECYKHLKTVKNKKKCKALYTCYDVFKT